MFVIELPVLGTSLWLTHDEGCLMPRDVSGRSRLSGHIRTFVDHGGYPGSQCGRRIQPRLVANIRSNTYYWGPDVLVQHVDHPPTRANYDQHTSHCSGKLRSHANAFKNSNFPIFYYNKQDPKSISNANNIGKAFHGSHIRPAKCFPPITHIRIYSLLNTSISATIVKKME